MATLAIELADTGILICDESGLVVGPSPGYVLLDNGALIPGLEAQAQARLKPRRVLNNFWDRLGTDALRRPFPEHLTNADLAHAHLDLLWKETALVSRPNGDEGPIDSLVLAIPSSFLTWQLGLLLGIARSAGLPVTGMVDSALAASTGYVDGARVLHVDVLLHRFVITEIDIAKHRARSRVEESGAIGMASLQDSWAKLISRRFVRSTRFDPLHTASSEQVLYDSLPSWLATLSEEEVAELSIDHGGRMYSIDCSRSQIVDSVEGQLRSMIDVTAALAEGDAPGVLLSARAAAIPGLKMRLAEELGIEPDVLPVGAAAQGALRHQSQIVAEGEDLHFVTRLGEAQKSAEAPEFDPGDSPSSGAVQMTRPPTHLVYRGTAYPISKDPFWLGTALSSDQRGINLTGSTAAVSRAHCHVRQVDDGVLVEDHSTYGTYLNGKPINGTTEADAGDLLRLGSPGIEIPLITVLEADG